MPWSFRSPEAANVHALRDPSPPDAARVRSWRKHAREGTLPPALLAWISALDGYVVLDGHDRLHAAALEDVTPDAISLHPIREHPLGDAVRDAAIARYERAFRAEARLSARTREALGSDLVRAASSWVTHTSSARHEPDLAARFARETEGLRAPEAVARIFARDGSGTSPDHSR